MKSKQYWAALAAVGSAAVAVPDARADYHYHTVSWYVSHPAEANQTLAWCQNNLGLAKAEPDCENALQASNLHSSQAFSSHSLTAIVGAPPTSVEHWINDPAGRKGQLTICRNIVAAHMQMPVETARACAAASAAGG
jgi:hypothetical protein